MFLFGRSAAVSTSHPLTRRLAFGGAKMNIQLSQHDKDIISAVRGILPEQSGNHKGSHGRIGVIGGSAEYTGAPYFAGISALRVGADLVHVFCVKDAAQPIKSYSPDLIVHPLLDHDDAVKQITKWLERLHVLVIGPGLGQDPLVLDNVKRLLEQPEMREKKLVIDADGLKLIDKIEEIPELRGILTPNVIEYQRLTQWLNLHQETKSRVDSRFVLVRKGERDLIYKPGQEPVIGADFAGSARRCGGQGDLLSGTIAAMFHWATDANLDCTEAAVVASQGASLLVRLCNAHAFAEKGRGALAADMVGQIPRVFQEYFERGRSPSFII